MSEKKTRQKRALIGKVVSHKMNKTIVVEIMRFIRHRLYKRDVKRTTKVYAHDKDNACQVGDIVKIVETRPISKNKVWELAEIVTKAS